MIKIILLKKSFLGNIGSILNVKSGYARNYLIPYNIAVYANHENIKKFSTYSVLLSQKEKNKILQSRVLCDKLKKLSPLLIKFKCSKNGKLFGSIKVIDICNILSSRLDYKFSKKNFFLPNGSLKFLGKYVINIFLYKDIKIDFIINIVSN